MYKLKVLRSQSNCDLSRYGVRLVTPGETLVGFAQRSGKYLIDGTTLAARKIALRDVKLFIPKEKGIGFSV